MILLASTLRDIVHVGVGIPLAASGTESLRGHGIGTVVQGSFLFLFDGFNALLRAWFGAIRAAGRLAIPEVFS